MRLMSTNTISTYEEDISIVGADGKARFMKAGEKLYDGEILSIEADHVTFRQDLTEENPAAPGLKSKEVVKRLHQEGTQ